jgi:tetratricopeptide (TPR) repeat protein
MSKMAKISTFLFISFLFSIQTLAQDESSVMSGELREEFIQKASKLRAQGYYAEAASMLDSILLARPEDAPILLFKGDLMLQANNFQKAIETYSKLLPLGYEPTTARINLSYALFMNHKPAPALVEARGAWEGEPGAKNAVVNYFNALLWNTKTKEAEMFLEDQIHLLEPSDVLVLKARLESTSGNYRTGLFYYDSLCNSFPNKYYVKEYSDVLLAKGKTEKAVIVFGENSELFNEKELKAFDAKIKDKEKVSTGTSFSLFNDIGGNVRHSGEFWFQQAETKTYPLRVSAGRSNLSSVYGGNVQTNFIHGKLEEHWRNGLSGETDLHFLQIKPGAGTSYGGLTGKQSLKYQGHDRRMITLFYSRDVLNFTPKLYEQNITAANLGYITHIMTGAKTGIYSQGSRGSFSDDNSKVEVFASLYHLFRQFPVFKTGLNYTYLHFSEQKELYFAPDKYSNAEVFADLSGNLPFKFPVKFLLQGGIGFQQIEENKPEPATRFQAELSTSHKSLVGSFKYQTSNVASGTGSGYKFNWFTLNLAYRW